MALYGYARVSSSDQDLTLQGRTPRIDAAEVRWLYIAEKMGATAISRQLGIGGASVYRVLERDEQPA